MFSNAACQKIKYMFAKSEKKIHNNIIDYIRNKIYNVFLYLFQMDYEIFLIKILLKTT